ncbi:hypothetical protein [Streptomyces sp. NBC_00989]|uniref:hypothetical protein n=1 Tax=Streptomyces sp. NBC_00989 TaxID=2903705 RepID=UPI00386E60DB|nr:hypothetical protein OG714_20480 [Streptomyces sp. NBC_00989]
MGRVRTALGLLAVVVGTTWLLGGPQTLRSGARGALVAAPYLLMAFAAILIVRTALPKGAALGPLVLLVGGGLWALAGQGGLSDVWQSRVVPLAVIALGALIALSRSGGIADDVVIPIRRYGSLFVPAHAKLLPSENGVRRIVVRAVFGSLRVDLSEAVFPQDDEERGVLYADVTVLFGRVEFVLGEDCAVVVAREIHTFGTSLAERVPVFANLRAYGRRRPSALGRRLEISLVGIGGAVQLDAA